jgi:hypothetical protein
LDETGKRSLQEAKNFFVLKKEVSPRVKIEGVRKKDKPKAIG